jgi:two-component system cell cycle response regulator
MKNIVHIDNSEFFRKLMKTFLQAEGFEVESFESARDAEMAIGGGAADMVIMGLTFADTEADFLIDRTVDSFSGPIIVVSSSLNSEREDKLIKQGIRAAISKSGSWQESLKPHLSALKQA